MTNIDDIFERGNAADLGEFFSFKNIGDRIAGTYVDLLEGTDGYGNEQYILVLRRDGVNHRVGIKKAHTYQVDKIRGVRLGQVIGFSFDEEKPNAGRAATKYINLKQDPSMVDETWMKEKQATEARYGVSPADALIPKLWSEDTLNSSDYQAIDALPFESAPANAAPVVASVPVAPAVATTASAVSPELMTTIKTLIVNKGILDAASGDIEVQAKVVEITGLPLTAENGPAIINKIATATV